MAPLRVSYDHVVVGGGSGGAVVARRLAEDPDRRVLLIEAGPSDAGIAAIHAAARWTDLLGGPYDWGYAYAPSPELGGRVFPIPRGKVLGGSGSINAMIWYRGHRSDYDAWVAAGASGWSFEEVLPFFRRAEDWDGGATAYRGAGGPLRIERAPVPHPIAAAMLEGARELGLAVLDDANGAANEGAAFADYNVSGDTRWSTARGYLHPAADWPNLTILTGSLAVGLGFEGNRCVAVRHLLEGGVTETRAERGIVLALGAIDTPRLLMRAGIGDADALRPLGIAVRADRPGVGKNLQDHPLLMGVNFRARRPLGPVQGTGGGAMMNWRSRPDLRAPDLHAIMVQGPHASAEVARAYDVTGDVLAFSPGLMGSKSVGFLRMLDPEPGGRMIIQPNFLAEPDDLGALVAGLGTVMDLAETAALRPFVAGPVSPDRRLSRREAIDFVRLACSTFFHPCGTCAMGQGRAAVVDPELRVHGVAGLRIADASVIPVIPSCNTQAPVVMIAERAADFIRRSPDE